MTDTDAEVIGSVIAEAIRVAIAPYEARITELEARGGGVSYAGTFVQGTTYAKGALCTRNGSLWLALEQTTLAPGSNPTAWRLIVKEGHAR